MTSSGVAAPVKDMAGPNLKSEALQSRLEAAPLRLDELKADLEHANRRILSLTERRGEVDTLSITNRIVALVKAEELKEIDTHIARWRGVAEYCEDAINNATGVVPELMKLYSAAAGVSTPSKAK